MHFEKISFEQWVKDYNKTFATDALHTYDVEGAYKAIKLPKQGTARSMGMDFFAPEDVTILPDNDVLIPTGNRWVVNPIDNKLGLIIVPRSGLGFKYGIRLVNTLGIIDADYQYTDNEGHIMIKLFNPSKERIKIKQGQGFAQGIVTPFFICDGAESDEGRTGGFGSTGQ